jgi:predicted nucleic acid-binding protein
LTLIVDAAPLVALADTGEPRREKVRATLSDEPGALVIPAPTTAELDYMLGQRFGIPARRAFLVDLATGRFSVAALEREEYARIVELEDRYADLELGLADCALVVLAARYRTTRILSFDERHFRAVRPLYGDTFTILPQDA